MIPDLSLEDAYNYARKKLDATDAIGETLFASKAHLVYQTLMDLFLLRDQKDLGTYFLEVMSQINSLKSKIEATDQWGLFHDFWKLGCSLKGLHGDEAKKIFTELKERRNRYLKQDKTLRSYLIGEKNFEAEVLRNSSVKDINNFIFSLMSDCEDNISLELKKGIEEVAINEAIKEFYESLGYKVEFEFGANIKDSTTDRIVKTLTITVIPEMFSRNAVAMISINNYE